MKNNLLLLIIILFVSYIFYYAGYQDGARQRRTVEPPSTYSTTQINDLIAHNTLLTEVIAQQLQYEKDIVTSSCK